jgi:hypothetical protein
MNNSAMKNRNTASNRSEIRRISMKNRLKIMVTSALLLAATSAMAGIIFVPVGGHYTNPELAPVNIQHFDGGTIIVLTNGLIGEWTIQGSDFPPEYEVPASATGKLPVTQQLELFIDLSTGVVEGNSSGQMLCNNEPVNFRADVRGYASCLPLNGRDCGQLVVDLELRGALSDPNNPASVGQMRMEMLGSLIWDDTDMMHWAAMSTNASLWGNDLFINSALEYARCRGSL